MNTRAVGIMMGAGLILAGCGVGTAQAAAHRTQTWQTVQLAQGTVMAQVRVPVTWTRNFGLTGAGDSVVMGPQNWSDSGPELGLRYGVIQGTSPNPVHILSYKQTYLISRELTPPQADVWVAVPNTPAYRKLAQTIIRSVKQIPWKPQKKG